MKRICLILSFLLLLLCSCSVKGPEDEVSNENSENPVSETPAASNTLAQDTEALSAYSGLFTPQQYEDDLTGYDINYNLYLPENYNTNQTYPLLVYIGDSTTVGGNLTAPVSRGRGPLLWLTPEWQKVHPTIVVVPCYPELIVDDTLGFRLSEYVNVTKRFIESLSTTYSVDTNRVYGTGQEMGATATLMMATIFPNLYTATVIVDGEWDVKSLKGLEKQKFVYFASEDDAKAWAGMQDVVGLFTTDNINFSYAQWDGNWTTDELTQAASELFKEGVDKYFISWAPGTIPTDNTGSSRMASFDYAYNSIAVMDWLFAQTK